MEVEQKRIILTNEVPNDQGGIIRNNTIDWSRFLSNPIMLYHHGKDPILLDTPIGHWEDLQFDGISWSAIPVFSNIPEAKKFKTLYEEGNLKASSIGGICIKKQSGYGQEAKNDKGFWESEYFLTYEASLTPIGSNATALQLNSPYLYTPEEILNEAEILTFNSKIKMPEKKEGEVQEVVETETKVKSKVEPKVEAKQTPEIKAEEEFPPVKHVILESDPSFLTELKSTIINGVKSIFATNPMHKEPDGDEPVKTTDKLPEGKQPSGATEKVETKMESDEAEMATKKAKEDSEKETEMAAKIEACNNSSEVEKLEAEYSGELPKVIKDAIAAKKEKYKTKLNSNTMPEIKTKEELAAEGLKLAEKTAKIVMGGTNVPSFSELRNKVDGLNIINRVTMSGGKTFNPEDHRTLLHSVLNDPRLRAIAEKVSFSDKSGNRSIPKQSLAQLASRFDSQQLDFMNFATGKLQNYTELDSTDNLLASPDLIAVEWLSIFLLALFPSAEWKSEIPVFSAQSTSKNKGLIFANIAADPLVYQGTRPSTPANYEYTDTAVSLTLSSFYLQPMLWQPLLMAMLRYDQQATGWAQAMLKFNTTIDNYLIYTLASLIPAANIVKTKGTENFTIAASTDPDSFLLNTAYTGTLAKPVLSDILVMDQIFKKQNYPEGTKFVVVNDPTMDRYITGDPETKSLLTRFVNSEGNELVSYKNGKLRTRSKVALVNPAASYAVVDSTGVVPATCISAGLALVPDQAGIGLANLDVFMIQDPTSYGYKMSADIRAGATLMRANGNGALLYTYGPSTGQPV
jgi:hypothetical protein